jgi:hypothetical protein
MNEQRDNRPGTADTVTTDERTEMQPGGGHERIAEEPATVRPAGATTTGATADGGTPMNEQTTLSTADMAAAAEQRTAQQTGGPKYVEGEETRPATGSEGAATMGGQPQGDTESTPLFAADEAQTLRSRWDEIQTGFVDEPRQAVEQADGLVAEAIKRLAEIFAGERSKLEAGWDRGDDVSTEDLRVALRRYRSFFDRLLSV